MKRFLLAMLLLVTPGYADPLDPVDSVEMIIGNAMRSRECPGALYDAEQTGKALRAYFALREILGLKRTYQSLDLPFSRRPPYEEDERCELSRRFTEKHPNFLLDFKDVPLPPP